MSPSCIAPMCIRVKDHSSVLCEQLQLLRQQTGLVDLDIVCEGHFIKVHKVVMAACSKFFKEQLCKFNVQAPVILRLDDFGLELKPDAVNYIIEFVYRGEVNILGEKLTDFCQAAHTLGVLGLEHLPVPAPSQRPPCISKDHLQIADESELRGDAMNVAGSLCNFQQVAQLPQAGPSGLGKLPMMEMPNINPFFQMGSMNQSLAANSDEIMILQTNEDSGGEVIPISFGGSSFINDIGLLGHHGVNLGSTPDQGHCSQQRGYSSPNGLSLSHQILPLGGDLTPDTNHEAMKIGAGESVLDGAVLGSNSSDTNGGGVRDGEDPSSTATSAISIFSYNRESLRSSNMGSSLQEILSSASASANINNNGGGGESSGGSGSSGGGHDVDRQQQQGSGNLTTNSNLDGTSSHQPNNHHSNNQHNHQHQWSASGGLTPASSASIFSNQHITVANTSSLVSHGSSGSASDHIQAALPFVNSVIALSSSGVSSAAANSGGGGGLGITTSVSSSSVCGGGGLMAFHPMAMMAGSGGGGLTGSSHHHHHHNHLHHNSGFPLLLDAVGCSPSSGGQEGGAGNCDADSDDETGLKLYRQIAETSSSIQGDGESHDHHQHDQHGLRKEALAGAVDRLKAASINSSSRLEDIGLDSGHQQDSSASHHQHLVSMSSLILASSTSSSQQPTSPGGIHGIRRSSASTLAVAALPSAAASVGESSMASVSSRCNSRSNTTSCTSSRSSLLRPSLTNSLAASSSSSTTTIVTPTMADFLSYHTVDHHHPQHSTGTGNLTGSGGRGDPTSRSGTPFGSVRSDDGVLLVGSGSGSLSRATTTGVATTTTPARGKGAASTAASVGKGASNASSHGKGVASLSGSGKGASNSSPGFGSASLNALLPISQEESIIHASSIRTPGTPSSAARPSSSTSTSTTTLSQVASRSASGLDSTRNVLQALSNKGAQRRLDLGTSKTGGQPGSAAQKRGAGGVLSARRNLTKASALFASTAPTDGTGSAAGGALPGSAGPHGNGGLSLSAAGKSTSVDVNDAVGHAPSADATLRIQPSTPGGATTPSRSAAGSGCFASQGKLRVINHQGLQQSENIQTPAPPAPSTTASGSDCSSSSSSSSVASSLDPLLLDSTSPSGGHQGGSGLASGSPGGSSSVPASVIMASVTSAGTLTVAPTSVLQQDVVLMPTRRRSGQISCGSRSTAATPVTPTDHHLHHHIPSQVSQVAISSQFSTHIHGHGAATSTAAETSGVSVAASGKLFTTSGAGPAIHHHGQGHHTMKSGSGSGWELRAGGSSSLEALAAVVTGQSGTDAANIARSGNSSDSNGIAVSGQDRLDKNSITEFTSSAGGNSSGGGSSWTPATILHSATVTPGPADGSGMVAVSGGGTSIQRLIAGADNEDDVMPLVLSVSGVSRHQPMTMEWTHPVESPAQSEPTAGAVWQLPSTSPKQAGQWPTNVFAEAFHHHHHGSLDPTASALTGLINASHHIHSDSVVTDIDLQLGGVPGSAGAALAALNSGSIISDAAAQAGNTLSGMIGGTGDGGVGEDSLETGGGAEVTTTIPWNTPVVTDTKVAVISSGLEDSLGGSHSPTASATASIVNSSCETTAVSSGGSVTVAAGSSSSNSGIIGTASKVTTMDNKSGLRLVDNQVLAGSSLLQDDSVGSDPLADGDHSQESRSRPHTTGGLVAESGGIIEAINACPLSIGDPLADRSPSSSFVMSVGSRMWPSGHITVPGGLAITLPPLPATSIGCNPVIGSTAGVLADTHGKPVASGSGFDLLAAASVAGSATGDLTGGQTVTGGRSLFSNSVSSSGGGSSAVSGSNAGSGGHSSASGQPPMIWLQHPSSAAPRETPQSYHHDLSHANVPTIITDNDSTSSSSIGDDSTTTCTRRVDVAACGGHRGGHATGATLAVDVDDDDDDSILEVTPSSGNADNFVVVGYKSDPTAAATSGAPGNGVVVVAASDGGESAAGVGGGSQSAVGGTPVGGVGRLRLGDGDQEATASPCCSPPSTLPRLPHHRGCSHRQVLSTPEPDVLEPAAIGLDHHHHHHHHRHPLLHPHHHHPQLTRPTLYIGLDATSVEGDAAMIVPSSEAVSAAAVMGVASSSSSSSAASASSTSASIITASSIAWTQPQTTPSSPVHQTASGQGNGDDQAEGGQQGGSRRPHNEEDQPLSGLVATGLGFFSAADSSTGSSTSGLATTTNAVLHQQQEPSLRTAKLAAWTSLRSEGPLSEAKLKESESANQRSAEAKMAGKFSTGDDGQGGSNDCGGVDRKKDVGGDRSRRPGGFNLHQADDEDDIHDDLEEDDELNDPIDNDDDTLVELGADVSHGQDADDVVEVAQEILARKNAAASNIFLTRMAAASQASGKTGAAAWALGQQTLGKMSSVASLSDSDNMLAIRSGIPLALQNKAIRSGVPIGPFQSKRKRKSRAGSQEAVAAAKPRKKPNLAGKKGDLEVRKDLTIESQQQQNMNKVEQRYRRVDASHEGGIVADHNLEAYHRAAVLASTINISSSATSPPSSVVNIRSPYLTVPHPSSSATSETAAALDTKPEDEQKAGVIAGTGASFASLMPNPQPHPHQQLGNPMEASSSLSPPNSMMTTAAPASSGMSNLLVTSQGTPVQTVHVKTVKTLNATATAMLNSKQQQHPPNADIANVEEGTDGLRFTCVQCSMMFYSAGQLKRHTQFAHSQEETLFCQMCPERCLGKENLKLHLYKTHGIGEMFRCEECNFESPFKSGYIKHISGHVPLEDKKKACPRCDKVFKTKTGLRMHLKQHFEESLSACKLCNFKTPQKTNLIKHCATKHGVDVDGRVLDMKFTCNQCDFKCVAEHLLKNHLLRKHTQKEAMRFQCTICDYATVEKAALEKHHRFRHTNERPFMCDTCGFSTHTASSMARHRRSHSQTKPHRCDICGHTYADKKRLRDHMYTHTNTDPFSCNLCQYTCRRKDNLSCHMKKHHDVTKEENEEKTAVPDSTSDPSAGASTSGLQGRLAGQILTSDPLVGQLLTPPAWTQVGLSDDSKSLLSASVTGVEGPTSQSVAAVGQPVGIVSAMSPSSSTISTSGLLFPTATGSTHTGLGGQLGGPISTIQISDIAIMSQQERQDGPQYTIL